MKKFLSVFLSVILVLGILPMGVWADVTGNWIDVADTAWYNDTDTTFTVDTAQELAGLAALVQGGNKFTGKTVQLGRDIDLAGKAWTPIGQDSTLFDGHFNGMGYTVSNLYIKDTSGIKVGLFGRVGASPEYKNYIQNLTVKNVDITGNQYVGAVVANLFVGEISDCKVIGDISINGFKYVGGIVGHAYASVKNCSVEDTTTDGGAIVASYQVGGIVGFLADGNYTVANCSVKNVQIKATYGGWIGGVAGVAHSGTKVENNTVTDITVEAGNDGYGISGMIVGQNIGVTSAPTYIINNQVINSEGTVNNTQLTVSSGEVGDAVAQTVVGTDVVLDEGKIVSGTFEKLTDYTYVEDGMVGKQGEDGFYTLITAAAEVDDYPYELFADAIAAANAATAVPTIVLYADITADFVLEQSAILVLNGHKLVGTVTAANENVQLTVAGDEGNESDIALAIAPVDHYDAVWANAVLEEGVYKVVATNTSDTIYAVSFAPTAYTITYDLNGGTLAGEANPTTYTIEDAVTLNPPSRPGYTFAGWIGTDLTDAQTDVTVPTGSTGERSYQATWETNTYTIRFDPAGGSFASNFPQSMTATYDNIETLPLNYGTYQDYNFAGWALVGDQTKVVYADGAQVKNLTAENNGTVTLYAVWTHKTVRQYNFTAQSYDYDEKVQAYDTTAYELPVDAKVTYDPNSVINAGSYDVIISIPGDETYAAYQTTIPSGLVINKINITVTYDGETVKEGESPRLYVLVDFPSGLSTTFAENPYIDAGDLPTEPGSYFLQPQGGVLVNAENYNIIYVGGYLTIEEVSSGTSAPIIYRNECFATTTGEFKDVEYFGTAVKPGDTVTLKVSTSDLGDQYALDYRNITVVYEVEGAVVLTSNYDYANDPIYKDGIATDIMLNKGFNKVIAHIYYNGIDAGTCAPFYAYVQ